MKELIKKIFDLAKQKDITVDVAIDHIRNEDDCDNVLLNKASAFVSDYYNIIVEARKSNDYTMLDKLISGDENER